MTLPSDLNAAIAYLTSLSEQDIRLAGYGLVVVLVVIVLLVGGYIALRNVTR